MTGQGGEAAARTESPSTGYAGSALDAILRVAQVNVVVLDRDLHVIAASRTAQRLFASLRRRELKPGADFMEFVTPPVRDPVRDHLTGALGERPLNANTTSRPTGRTPRHGIT